MTTSIAPELLAKVRRGSLVLSRLPESYLALLYTRAQYLDERITAVVSVAGAAGLLAAYSSGAVRSAWAIALVVLTTLLVAWGCSRLLSKGVRCLRPLSDASQGAEVSALLRATKAARLWERAALRGGRALRQFDLDALQDLAQAASAARRVKQ